MWTEDGARKFLKAVKESENRQDAALFALALDGGLRRGELRGLLWKDLNGSTLRVERQLFDAVETNGVFALDTTLPKGKCARTIDLSDETLSLLREHKRQQAELKLKNRLHYVDLGLMFAQGWEEQGSKNAKLGLPLSVSWLKNRLARVCKESGVKRISPHGLRHTCTTLLMLANVPVVVVAKRLGHASPAMTLNIYSHALPSMQKDAASRLQRVLHE